MQSAFSDSLITQTNNKIIHKKSLFSKHTHIYRCYIHGSWLCEDVCVDVHHQIASCCVLHNKTHMLWSLEACKQVDQEGMVRHVHGLKDALLAH